MNAVHKRKFVMDLAWKMYGTPYLWGGDDPLGGLDCSGLVVELLKSVGLLPLHGDWTANDLWERYQDKVVDKPAYGCLVFLQYSNGHVRHVELCWDDEISIGASSGDRSTRNIERAIEQNAYVKFRPREGRGKIKGFVDPFKVS